MSEYLLGVITPFAAIAGLALALGLTYLMLRLGGWLNQKIHYHFVETIELEKNRVNPFDEKPVRPEFEDSANRLRDALLISPKLTLIRIFGRIILVARDYEEKKSDG